MNLFRWRQRKDEELDAEIRSHLDEAIRDRIARPTKRATVYRSRPLACAGGSVESLKSFVQCQFLISGKSSKCSRV